MLNQQAAQHHHHVHRQVSEQTGGPDEDAESLSESQSDESVDDTEKKPEEEVIAEEDKKDKEKLNKKIDALEEKEFPVTERYASNCLIMLRLILSFIACSSGHFPSTSPSGPSCSLARCAPSFKVSGSNAVIINVFTTITGTTWPAFAIVLAEVIALILNNNVGLSLNADISFTRY